MTKVAWWLVRWSGGVTSTWSALRLPLLFVGVSNWGWSYDFSETERSMGSLAVRGVRGRRSGVGGGGVDVIDGNAAEDGPAPPFCL